MISVSREDSTRSLPGIAYKKTMNIRTYPIDLVKVFIRPGKFFAARDMNSDRAAKDALQFLLVSTAISAILFATLPVAGPMGVGSRLASSGIGDRLASFVVISIYCAIFGAFARFGWFLVGGKAGRRAFYATYAYLGSILMILAPVVLAIISTAMLSEMKSAIEFGRSDFAEKAAMIAGFTAFLACLVVVGTWVIIFWNSFRKLNNLSVLRSFCTMVVAGALQVAAIKAISFILALAQVYLFTD